MVEPLGFGSDDHGGARCGFSATATVDRKDVEGSGNKTLAGSEALILVRTMPDIGAALERRMTRAGPRDLISPRIANPDRSISLSP